jgi:hypothetical protein
LRGFEHKTFWSGGREISKKDVYLGNFPVFLGIFQENFPNFFLKIVLALDNKEKQENSKKVKLTFGMIRTQDLLGGR